MDFSLIKLKGLQSEGKIWVTDLHFNVLTIYYYIIYWQNITCRCPYAHSESKSPPHICHIHHHKVSLFPGKDPWYRNTLLPFMWTKGNSGYD